MILLDDFIYNKDTIRQYCLIGRENIQEAQQWLQLLLTNTIEYLSNSTLSVEIQDLQDCQIGNIQKVYKEFINNDQNSDITNPKLFDICPNNQIYNMQNQLANIMFIKNQPLIYNWNQVARGVHRINWWLVEVVKRANCENEKIIINTSQFNFQQSSNENYLISQQRIEQLVKQNLYSQAKRFIILTYYQQIKQFLIQSPCTLNINDGIVKLSPQDDYYKETSLAINNFNTCVATVQQNQSQYQTIFAIVDKQGKYRAHLILDDYQNKLFNPMSSSQFRSSYNTIINNTNGNYINRKELENIYRSAILNNQQHQTPSQIVQRILSEARLQDFLVSHGVLNILVLNNSTEICNQLTQNLKQTIQFLNKGVDQQVYDQNGLPRDLRKFCDYIHIEHQETEKQNKTLIPNFIFKQQQLAPFIRKIQIEEMYSNLPQQIQKIHSINQFDFYGYNIDRRIYNKQADIGYIVQQNMNNIKNILNMDVIHTINMDTKLNENTIEIQQFNKLKTTQIDQQTGQRESLEIILQTLIWAVRYYYHPIETITCFTEGGKYTNRLLEIKGLNNLELINTDQSETQYQKMFQSNKKLIQMADILLKNKTTTDIINEAIRFQVIRKTVDLNSCFLNSWYVYQYLYLPNMNAQKLDKIFDLLQKQILSLQTENKNQIYGENNQKYLATLQEIKQQFNEKQNIQLFTEPQYKFQQLEQNLTQLNILLKRANQDESQKRNQLLNLFTSKEQFADCIYTLLIQNQIFEDLTLQNMQTKFLSQELQDMMQNSSTNIQTQWQILSVNQLLDNQTLSFDQQYEQISQQNKNKIIKQANELYDIIQMHTVITSEVISQLPIYSGFVPLDRESLLRNENTSCLYTVAAMYRCYCYFPLEQFKIFQNVENRDAIVDTKYFQQLIDYNYHFKSPKDYQCTNIVSIKTLDGQGIVQDDDELNDEIQYENHKQSKKQKQKQIIPIQSDIVANNPIQQISWYDSMPINNDQAILIMIICVLFQGYSQGDIDILLEDIAESPIQQLLNQLSIDDRDLYDLYDATFKTKDLQQLYLIDNKNQLLQQKQILQLLHSQKFKNSFNPFNFLQSTRSYKEFVQQYYNIESDQNQTDKHDSINDDGISSDFQDDSELEQGLLIQFCNLFQKYYNPIQQFDQILNIKLKEIDFKNLDVLYRSDKLQNTLKAICIIFQTYKIYDVSSLNSCINNILNSQVLQDDQNDIFENNNLITIIKQSIPILKEVKGGINYRNSKINFLQQQKQNKEDFIQQLKNKLSIKHDTQLSIFTPIQVKLPQQSIESFRKEQNIDDKYIKVKLQQNDAIESILSCNNLNQCVDIGYQFTSFIVGMYKKIDCPFQLRNSFQQNNDKKSIGKNYGRVLALHFNTLLINYIISNLSMKQNIDVSKLQEYLQKQYNENKFNYDQYNTYQQTQSYQSSNRNSKLNLDQMLSQNINLNYLIKLLLGKSQIQNEILSQKQKQDIIEQLQLYTNMNIDIQQLQQYNTTQSQMGLSQLQSQYQQNSIELTQQNYFQYLIDQFINITTYYKTMATLLSDQLNYLAEQQLMNQQINKQFTRICDNPIFKPNIYQNNTNQILQLLEKEGAIIIPVMNSYDRLYACFLTYEKDINGNQIVFLPLREIKQQNQDEQIVSEHVELLYDSIFELDKQHNKIFKQFKEVVQYIQKLRDFIDDTQKVIQIDRLKEYSNADRYYRYVCKNAKYNCYRYQVKKHKEGKTYSDEFYIIDGGIVFRNAFVQLEKLSNFSEKIKRGDLVNFGFNKEENRYNKTIIKD